VAGTNANASAILVEVEVRARPYEFLEKSPACLLNLRPAFLRQTLNDQATIRYEDANMTAHVESRLLQPAAAKDQRRRAKAANDRKPSNVWTFGLLLRAGLVGVGYCSTPDTIWVATHASSGGFAQLGLITPAYRNQMKPIRAPAHRALQKIRRSRSIARATHRARD